MPNNDQRDQYAAELNERYEAFVRWTKENWPNQESPLMDSDFAAARRELSLMCGARLGGGDRTADTGGSSDTSAQYVPVNPMPWP